MMGHVCHGTWMGQVLWLVVLLRAWTIHVFKAVVGRSRHWSGAALRIVKSDAWVGGSTTVGRAANWDVVLLRRVRGRGVALGRWLLGRSSSVGGVAAS